MRNGRINTVNEDNESINLKYYLYKSLSIWYVFVISVLLALVAAYIYTLKVPLEFEAKSTLLAQDSDSKGGTTEFFTGFGLFDSPKKIENEIAILSSYQIAEKTIKNSNNYVKYYKKDRLRKENIYLSSPFFVEIDTTQAQMLGTYKATFKNGEIIIDYEDVKDESFIYRYSNHTFGRVHGKIDLKISTGFDEWTSHDYLNIRIVRNSQYKGSGDADDEYYFQLFSLDQLSQTLMSSLSVEPLSKQSDVISIKLTNDNAFEAVDLLNSLLQQYFIDNLSEKNRNAINTIDFIDSQLMILSDSLSSIETQLEEFKKTNQIVNINAQSASIFNQLQLYEGKLAMANLKMKYFEYLKEYISNASDYSDILVPSIMDVNDPMLNNLITSLLELNSEKIRILSVSTSSNPLLTNINNQIKELKKAINGSVNSLISSTEIEISELKGHIRQFESEMNKIPGIERTLIGIERNFTIDNEIYTYLLKKRAESAIAKASNEPDGKIIDPAKIELTRQTRPKKMPVFTIFGLIGLMIPVAFIVFRKQLFDFIDSTEDIDGISDIPLLGTIPHSGFDSEFVMKDHPKSYVAESFRYIRTSIEFMMNPDSSNIILITSSMPQEGKTFMAINLAYSFANTEKRTIIIGGDLRNPSLSNVFEYNGTSGLSTYLSGVSDLDKIIHKTDEANLDVIYAGIIPPNPSELIGSRRMEELFEALRKKYDCIIIDSPPVNLTTEAIQLINKVDVSVYMVRVKRTRRACLQNIISLKDQKKIKNTAFVLNGLKMTFGGSYSYTYRYAKNYGYTNDEPKRKGLFARFKR